MKRRKGKSRKHSGRSQPIRLLMERLETRQLLAGFVSIAVPGAVETGTVEFIESASHINVKVAESVCVPVDVDNSDLKVPLSCLVNNSTFLSNDTFFSSVLAVGDGFGFNYSRFDGVGSGSPASNPSTVEVGTDPEPSNPDPIAIITEDPVVEATPTDPARQPDPEIGVYYAEPNPLTGDQPIDAATTTLPSTSQPRIAALERVQMFSLLTPADIPGTDLPSFDEPVIANPLPNPYKPTNNQVDSMFEGLDEELDFLPRDNDGIAPTFDISKLNLEALKTEAAKPLELTNPLAAPGLGQTSLPTLGVLPTVPLNVLEDVLRAMVVEVEEQPEPEVKQSEEVPVRPELPDDEADDKEPAGEIYLVEGVILMAALPSYQVRRHDDESEGGFSG